MSSQDVLSSLGHATRETEFFTPMPSGYTPGKTKYVVVFGTVMSGLGKGIFSSSLAKILKDKGVTVAPVKLEGYLNRDSGTLNPFRHGEVFVLDDGMECDMDLGTYERMLNQNLSRINFCTSGQIFSSVLDKERQGKYLGRDVQMIPHVTGEVKLRLRELATAAAADLVFVEIGGTAGDFENAFIIEAVREMSYEEGPANFCFVALTYIVQPQVLGEQKSKPAQLNLKLLNAAGIHPHIIACRCSTPVTKQVREKISLFSSVPMERVFSMHDCDSIYVVPEMLRSAGIDAAVIDLLELEDRIDHPMENNAWQAWNQYITNLRSTKESVTIGIIGKYTTVRDSYASIIQALEHAGAHLQTRVRIDWVDSTDLTESNTAKKLSRLHGVIVPGGFGFRGVDGKLACVRYVRENGIPYLGLCYGMQIAVIEYARHVAGLTNAGSTEIEPDCPQPVIDILPSQKNINALGGTMRLGGHNVLLKSGSLVARLYGTDRIRLRFRHRFEVNPQFVPQLENAGLYFSGISETESIVPGHSVLSQGEPRALARADDQSSSNRNRSEDRYVESKIALVLELPPDVHLYFVATQAHPELTSRPLQPEPMFVGLVGASRRFAGLSAALTTHPVCFSS